MPSSLGVDEDDLFNLAICPEGYKGNFKKIFWTQQPSTPLLN